MSRIEPRIFKGARDFLPEQMLHRENILAVMREVFRKYGFAPMETPAIEYLEILAGKYGEDADRLIYRLNYKTGSRDEAALHYDLTVPFSRVMAMNPQLTLPFKRYQIQPVWRADRPQPHQGRFREFYQCDIDAVGTDSLIVDAEMVTIVSEILSKLGFNGFVIRINNRKILNGLVDHIGLNPTHTAEICRSVDKLDKQSWDSVSAELQEKNIPPAAISKLGSLVGVQQRPTLDSLKIALSGIAIAEEGIAELETIFGYLQEMSVPATHYAFDLSLARGLDYYTGPIFETVLPEHPHIGSLTGGGRYNGLIGMFSGKDMPAVGTTLGLDRIFTAMQQLQMLEDIQTATKVLVANFAEDTLQAAMQCATALRKVNIPAELFPETAKLKKQLGYADKKGIPFVVIIGEEELAKGSAMVKDLRNGTQEEIPAGTLPGYIKEKL